MIRALLVGCVILASGCLRSTEFHCTTSADCGPGGTCEVAVGFCSTADGNCASGARFGSSAGAYANKCVDDGAPTDAPVVDGSVDGMAVDAPTTCPADFTTMTGGQAGHVYRLVDQVQNWQAQTSFCAGTSTQAYLAIPDDLAELQAIAVRSGVPQSWVGITDQAVEGTFLTVKGVPAVFLPWDTGQPDDAGPGEDCVIIQTQTSKLRDERCSTKFKAVCECDP